jgi:hypothetical protein
MEPNAEIFTLSYLARWLLISPGHKGLGKLYASRCLHPSLSLPYVIHVNKLQNQNCPLPLIESILGE